MNKATDRIASLEVELLVDLVVLQALVIIAQPVTDVAYLKVRVRIGLGKG